MVIDTIDPFVTWSSEGELLLSMFRTWTKIHMVIVSIDSFVTWSSEGELLLTMVRTWTAIPMVIEWSSEVNSNLVWFRTWTAIPMVIDSIDSFVTWSSEVNSNRHKDTVLQMLDSTILRRIFTGKTLINKQIVRRIECTELPKVSQMLLYCNKSAE